MLKKLIQEQFTGLQVSRLKWLWLAVLTIILDFATKQMAEHFLQYAQPVYVLPVFDLTLLYNKGAAFSFLANESGWQRWFFTLIAISPLATTRSCGRASLAARVGQSGHGGQCA